MLHEDEVLSDNTRIKRCKQCKDCLFWGGDNNFENQFDKMCCRMFPYPDNKPREVVENTGKCKYRLKR